MQEAISLKPFNSFGLEISAQALIEIHQTEELPEIVEQSKDAQILILGGGTNILFTKNFSGKILKMSTRGIEIIEETSSSVLIEVQAGEIWHDLVMWTIENDLGGLENLALIPGSVGAAPIQNIGAYGVEQAQCFDSCTVWDREEHTFQNISKQDCGFGYRNSIFKSTHKHRYIICSVRYRLQKKPHHLELSYGGLAKVVSHPSPTIKDVAQAVIQIRQSKLPDPQKLGNAGSFFKNPIITGKELEEIQKTYPEIPTYPSETGNVKIPAAWLIDTLGWKGYRKGDAGVHKNQALVLVNHGKAQGFEIQQLSEAIQKDVLNRFGISLIPEVNIL